MRAFPDTKTISGEDLTVDMVNQESSPIVPLVGRLCNSLSTGNINYCHWKSNNVIERSASGINDLDLLVGRNDEDRFTEILSRLGFKQAKAPPVKQMPGVLDFFGYDEDTDHLIHVHAHYQLMLGHDMTKNYRLPVEKPYLESAVQDGMFKVPSPEFEYIVFVIRMVLKHSTWDAILGREGSLKKGEQQEFVYLQNRINQEEVHHILNQHLPYINGAFFDKCIRTLLPDYGLGQRVKTAHQLQTKLQFSAQRSLPADTFLKLWRRGVMAFQRRLFKSSFKYQLQSGGALIAIIGGDGAGKSTAIDGLTVWLSKNFDLTQFHMGKPKWSWTTITVRSILKLGQLLHLYPLESTFNETLEQKSVVSPGYPWLLREVCRARDRYWTYRKAQRYAINGSLVLFDRFPHPQIQLMDGPQAERFISQLAKSQRADLFLSPKRSQRLAKYLIDLEESYYQKIPSPELLIVLRVNPEIAVQRKTDEESSSVRERSTEIWEVNWQNTEAFILDSSKSKTETLNNLKALIWSEL